MKVVPLMLALLVWAGFVVVVSYLYMVDSSNGQDTGELVDRLDGNEHEHTVKEAVKWLNNEQLTEIDQLNLRGLACKFDEETHELEHCYDPMTMDRCPKMVDPVYLSVAHGQTLCQADTSSQFYCSVHCTATGDIEWKAHSIEWCERLGRRVPSCRTDDKCCPPFRPPMAHENVLDMKLVVGGNGVPHFHAPTHHHDAHHVEDGKRIGDSGEGGGGEHHVSERELHEMEESYRGRLREVALETAAAAASEGVAARTNANDQRVNEASGGRRGRSKRTPTPQASKGAGGGAVNTEVGKGKKGRGGAGVSGSGEDGPPTHRQPFNGQDQLGSRDRARLDKYGFNLRGLTCQHDEGTVVCYRTDNQARERCPPHVTPAFLSLAKGQYTCEPGNAPESYCTAMCQEGSDEIRWSAYERKWCQSNPGNCPPEPPYVPVEEYETPPFEELKQAEIEGVCTGGSGTESGPPPENDDRLDITVGILANGEVSSLRDAMRTWADGGLFRRVKETLVYLNSRSDEMNEMLAPYTKAPHHVRVMGDRRNHGITHGINFLAGNASTPHLLFMEKDFQQVEGPACIEEQLRHGLRLLAEGKAHVVKYRSRRHPGFPNWVDQYYRGKEDTCFKSHQPNLCCNMYHWVERPDERWGAKFFYDCDKTLSKDGTKAEGAGHAEGGPKFYCTDAYYCNWTNNPILIKIAWWMKEYVNGSFKKKLSGNDPYKHLEGYMNWEPHAWNDRKWVVAQGEGMFTHRDRSNYGS